MKSGIKYVTVLSMLFVMLLSTTAFAAEKGGNFDLKQGRLLFNIIFDKDCGFKNESANKIHKLVIPASKVQKSSAAPAPKIQQQKPAAPAPKIQKQKPAAPAPKVKKPATPALKVQKPSTAPAPKVRKPVAPAPKVKKPAAPAPEVKKPAVPAPEAQKPAEKPAVSPSGNYESQVAELVNKERAAQGLAPLKFNSDLSKVAKLKAQDLRDKNYFSHTSPTYGSPFDMMKSYGIRYTAAGENIAKGYMTPAAVMKGWMNSPGHRANIMNNNFTEIGVGYVTDSSGAGYWVQMFIRP